MSLARETTGALALALVLVSGSSCDPIVPTPASTAPMNSCSEFPCERYDLGRANAQARCSIADRCELPGNRPDGKFFLVIYVPDTASFGPGMTFVMASDELDRRPAAQNPCPVTTNTPLCFGLPNIGETTSTYRIQAKVGLDVNFPTPLPPEATLPARVVFRQLSTADEAISVEGLPLDVFFTTSIRNGNDIEQKRTLPWGRYERVAYPLPPFDAWFPPNREGTIESPFQVKSTRVIDDYRLGSLKSPLDDVAGTTRTAVVKRVEGLAGWRVWLNDRVFGRRISTLKTLTNTDEATVRLDTAGENNRGPNGSPGLGDDVDAIVAPPEGSIGIPRLVTTLFGGQGLQNLAYPELPPPVGFRGQVTGKSRDGVTVGFSARVTFDTSTLGDILRTRSGTDPLLSYSTTVATDEAGRFATVLPPGSYTVKVEPAEGTGFANKILRRAIEVGTTLETFEVDLRTRVRGRAVLSDNRPLSDAEVLATPVSTDPTVFRPRPGKARTDREGAFEMFLDQGSYQFAVLPQAGTGFPRFVVRHPVPPTETDLPVMRVPAPVRFAFSLRDPQNTNPIALATVRVFGVVPTGSGSTSLVELGSAMSDFQGRVEILVAQQQR